ncbi:hypothetical protein MKEN_00334400 [Mycena kentingensis (nom. inval.)]|nr:hypothetical protein MKEN_00334400 [Mycena kentingensis (nom. inval.)]
MSTSEGVDAAAIAGAGLQQTETAFTLDNTLGAALVGFAASCVVYGVLLTQTWAYFKRFSLDSAVYKILVLLVVGLATADQALIGHFVYFYALASAGNPLALVTGTTTFSIILQQAIGSVGGAIVKCAFASRVYRFSERNLYITGFIVALCVGQLAVSLAFTVKAFGLTTIPTVFQLKTLGTISLALGVATDIVTAAALCFFLRRLRTGYKPADSLVRRLVIDAINTGICTCVLSLCTLFLFYFLTGNLFFAATFFLLSKLYGISFLATLNSRRAVRGRGTDAETGALDEPSNGLSGPGSRSSKRAQEETNIFALGTRMPSIYEDVRTEYASYPLSMDAKPAAGRKEARGLHPQTPYGF